MKKLSLFLALVLVFSCIALAACSNSEDNTSADTSSTAGDTSSKADTSKDNSKAEESSKAESSEEESSEEESVEPVEITGENIALGKSYEISQLYRQGDASNDYAYTPENDIDYPDEDGVSLTDGALATELQYTDPAWAGFHARCPDYLESGYAWITVDLGEATDITGARVYVGTAELGGGINAPASIELLASDDGEEWTSVVTVNPTNVTTEEGIGTECVDLGGYATCRYVQIRLVAGGWCFVSEVEVYAEAE